MSVCEVISDERLLDVMSPWPKRRISQAQRKAINVMKTVPRLTRSHARLALGSYMITLNAMCRHGLARYMPDYDAWELTRKGTLA